MMEWQNCMKNINEKLKFLYFNGRFADVNFLVESETVSAARFVLAAGSPVFERMFYGNFNTDSDENIVVADIGVRGFKLMIKYLYTDEIEFTDVEDAWQTMEAANKYLIINLKKECENFLIKFSFDRQTVCAVLEKADFYALEDLKEHCMQFIEENGAYIFDNGGLKSLKLETIILILQRCSYCFLHVEEVLEAVMQWAEDKNQQSKSEIAARDFIDPILPYIRYENLDAEAFSSFIAKYPDVFSESENLAMLMYLIKPGSCVPPSWFSNPNDLDSYHIVKDTEDLSFRHRVEDLKFNIDLYTVRLKLFWILAKPIVPCSCTVEIFVTYVMKRFYNPERNCWDVVLSCKESFCESVMCHKKTEYVLSFPNKFDFAHQTTDVLIEGKLHFDQPVSVTLLKQFPASNLGAVDEEKRGNGFGILRDIMFEQI